MADKKPEKKQECVQVVVRCRPFSTKEKKENRGHIIGVETALFQARIKLALDWRDGSMFCPIAFCTMIREGA